MKAARINGSSVNMQSDEVRAFEPADADSEIEFQRAYRRPAAKHLGIGCAMACCAVLAFYVIELVGSGLPVLGGAQTIRLCLATGYLGIALFCWSQPRAASRHYAALFFVATVLLVAVACYISFERHKSEATADILWAQERTLIICVIFTFGCSRLPAGLTLAVAGFGTIAALTAYAIMGLAPIDVVARVVVHLLIVGGCGFSFLRVIQHRERDLFLLARDRLRHKNHESELERARRAAEDADAATSRFLANVSHEVRAPMSGVLQILETVGAHANFQDRALIEKGRNAGQAVLKILDKVLDHAELSHGVRRVESTPIDIVEVCRTAIDLHMANATMKQIDFRSRLDLPPSGETRVLADEVKLLEIMNNLLANALKFTESGFVELSVHLSIDAPSQFPKASLRVVVRDSGRGIPPGDLDKVFLPFFRGIDKASPPVSGTGLGLSIVKELVSLLGGTISIESQLAAGTAFRVTLPVEIVRTSVGATDNHADLSTSGTEKSVAQRPAEFAGRKLLLVDDNELNSFLASQVIEMLGFEVARASDGREAVDKVAHARFDIILMDCQMPTMDGYEATRRIRQLEAVSRATRTPIIAVTAYTLKGDREKCLAAGMDDYLSKPYSVKDLQPLLRRFLASASPLSPPST